MKVILKREYYIFRHNLIFFLCIWTLLPIAIYILISTSIGESVVLPESFSDMNYNNWSAAGNWVVSTCIITYLLSGISIKKYKEKSSFSNSMLATPATNIEHVLGLTIWILIIAFIQLCFSLAITQFFENSHLSFSDYFVIIIYMLPIILFTINLTFFFGLLINSKYVQRLISIILFMYLFFGTGLFIPLSDQAKKFFTYFPINQTFIQIQEIILPDKFTLPYQAIITLFLSICIFFINLVLTHKTLKS